MLHAPVLIPVPVPHPGPDKDAEDDSRTHHPPFPKMELTPVGGMTNVNCILRYMSCKHR
jgi:hypothetical protein